MPALSSEEIEKEVNIEILRTLSQNAMMENRLLKVVRDELFKAVEELKKRLKNIQEPFNMTMHMKALDDIDQLTADNKELRRYITHKVGCKSRSPYGCNQEKPKCNCGYADLISKEGK